MTQPHQLHESPQAVTSAGAGGSPAPSSSPSLRPQVRVSPAPRNTHTVFTTSGCRHLHQPHAAAVESSAETGSSSAQKSSALWVRLACNAFWFLKNSNLSTNTTFSWSQDALVAAAIFFFSFPDLSYPSNNQSRSYFPFVFIFFCPNFKSATFVVRLESEASVLPAASVASRHILTTGSSLVEKFSSRRRRSFAGINEELRWIAAVVVNCRSRFLDSSRQGDLVGRWVSQGETERD